MRTDGKELVRYRVDPHRGAYRFVRRRWRIAAGFIDAIGRVAVRASPPDPYPPPERILVVQFDHLGDAVLTSGFLAALRSAYPAAQIDVLCGPWTADFFAACPAVNHVQISRGNRFARGRRRAWFTETIAWGRRLRARRYDLAIDVRGELPNALLLRLTGATRRLGWDAGGGGFWLTDRPRFVAGRHEVESRAALLTALGIEVADPVAACRPRFEPTDEARDQIDERLDHQRVGVPLVAIHVGAGTTAKRWPPVHWREVVGRLVCERGASVVLVGGAAERGIARSILHDRDWRGLADWTGQLGIVELAALFERADLFVGCDSGPAHLAAAVGAACVVLFSGTNLARQWRPWGERVAVVGHVTACSPCHRTECPVAGHPCMTGLEPWEVWREIERMLDGLSGRENRRQVRGHDDEEMSRLEAWTTDAWATRSRA